PAAFSEALRLPLEALLVALARREDPQVERSRASDVGAADVVVVLGLEVIGDAGAGRERDLGEVPVELRLRRARSGTPRRKDLALLLAAGALPDERDLADPVIVVDVVGELDAPARRDIELVGGGDELDARRAVGLDLDAVRLGLEERAALGRLEHEAELPRLVDGEDGPQRAP